MLDAHILAAVIADRSAYEQIHEFINTKDFSPATAFWWDLVCEYYGRDKNCATVDIPTLRGIGEKRITNPKHVQSMVGALDGLPNGVSAANIAGMVLDLRRYNLAAEFASHAMSGDRKKADKLLVALNDVWDKTELKKSEVEYAKDWNELDSVVGSHNRVPIGPKSLDTRTGGGALPGHHVLVFGRTEVGKSCFAINAAGNFIRAGKRVLYVGNEDEINVLKTRLRLNLLNRSQQWIDSHPIKASRLLAEATGNRLTMVKATPGSISEVEDLVAKHTPSVLVVDQIRNLSGPEDGMTQRMEGNAIRFRSLLGRHHLIGLSVTQAGDRSMSHNADSPIYLSTGDVDSSRVGLPGTVDLMIGIGGNRDMLAKGLRALSLCKNKLMSGAASREPLIVKFDLARSIVSD